MPLFLSRLHNVKLKFLLITTLFLIAYLVIFSVLSMWYLPKRGVLKPLSDWNSLKKVSLKYIVVHLDLKGSPPKLEYLESLLPMLKKLNVNGLLIEYEDMFPYEGKLANLSARNYYKKPELERFLTVVLDSGFEIIPLIQTFGHLEYALKLPEFKNLREVPKFPDSICPSKRESQEFLREMLKQVIEFHETLAPLKHFHIGFDEVYHINKCEDCCKRNVSKIDLFIPHMDFVTKIVRTFSPHATILFWDDMFRSINPGQRYYLSIPNAAPVFWDYTPDEFITHNIALHTHQMNFGKIWVATAFKGADGRTQIVPDLRKRFFNHIRWLELILQFGNESKSKLYNFEGIILTGWSRFSHMDPPCELLPVSIPSLTLNLMVIDKYLNGSILENDIVNSYFQRHIQEDFNLFFNCKRGLDGHLNFQVDTCNFEAFDMYSLLLQCKNFKKVFADLLITNYGLSLQENFLEMGYINMNIVKDLLNLCYCSEQRLVYLEQELSAAMSNYFDEYVIDEYVVFILGRIKKYIHDVRQMLKDHDAPRVWSRGPSMWRTKTNEHNLTTIQYKI